MCVYKSETSRQSLKNVSFYFSKNEVIARAPRLAVGTGTWKSFSASLRLFCVTLNSLPTQLVPEHMFVLQCWHVNVLRGFWVTRWKALCFQDEKGKVSCVRASPSHACSSASFAAPLCHVSVTRLACGPCYRAAYAGFPDEKGFALLWCLGFSRGNPLSLRFETGFLPSLCS